MPTTCRDIIDAAYSRSTFNDPGKIATDKELIGVIDRRMKQLYSIVARENPEYFGDLDEITPSNNAWPRPNDAELIHRVELPSGDKVNITTFDDRRGEQPPAVYQYGQKYRSAGRSDDPAGTETLTFYFARRHKALDPEAAPTSEDNTLEELWPEQFNDLVVLHVARYLSTKDGRNDEIQVLAMEEQALMEVFMRHLAHENYGKVARWGHRARLISERPEGFRGE